MVLFNIVVLGATIVLVCIFIYIYKNPEKFSEKNTKIISVSEYIQFIGVILAVVTLSITCIINIVGNKASKFEVELLDINGADWSSDHHNGELPGLGIDVNNHLTFTGKTSDTWCIAIGNKGNSIAEEVSIRISLDGVMFFGMIDDYDVSSHLHGIGGYKYVVRNYENIKPDEVIILPILPLENMEILDYNEYPLDIFTMHVEIFSKESIMFSQDFTIEKNDTDEISQKCKYDIDETRMLSDDEMFALYMNKKLFDTDKDFIFKDSDLSGVNYRDYTDCELIVDNNSYKADDYQRVYKFYLEKLNVYNLEARKIYTEFSTVYGRLYYISCSQTDIDEKISNDIDAHTIK